MLLSVQFCIKISQLTDQVKNLSQENALMKAEIESLAADEQENQAISSRAGDTA